VKAGGPLAVEIAFERGPDTTVPSYGPGDSREAFRTCLPHHLVTRANGCYARPASTIRATGPAASSKRMKLVWIGTGANEPERMMQGMKVFREGITREGIEQVCCKSQGTGHEWLTWRRALRRFACLPFRS
jgi:hypothetical protein